jgi:riboflavin biosynthesis pyrimidine reductase
MNEPTDLGPEMPRPRVITWNIASLDGRLALGQLFALGEVDVPDVRALHGAEAMMTGADSMWPLDAFPRPPAALPVSGDPARLFEDSLEGLTDPPVLLVVTDSRGRLPPDAFRNLLTPSGQYAGLRLLMLVSRCTPASYLAYLRDASVDYLVVGSERVDLSLAMRRLYELGVRTLVSDGGGLLHGALLGAGLVDEVDVLFVPGLIGMSRGPVLFDGPPWSLTGPAVRMKPLSIEPRADGSLFLRYAVADIVRPLPWSPD